MCTTDWCNCPKVDLRYDYNGENLQDWNDVEQVFFNWLEESLMFRTKPGYSATTVADISTEVPDDENGVIAFAETEQTAWQLSKFSTDPLSADVIATKSGIGRWLRYRLANESFVPREISWRGNGDLSLFTVDAAAPVGDGGDSFFDGAVLITDPMRIVLLTMTQRASGSAGVTTAEVWRSRGGAFFLLGLLSIPAGLPLDAANTIPPPSPDDELIFGDLVLVRFTAVQTADPTTVPQDVVIQIHGVSK